MRLDWGWLQRRFWDFRQGHSLGLAFILGFVNFIVLNYALLISNVTFLSRIFPHLWMFALVFFCTYLPLSILIGYFGFRKRQFHTDLTIATLENPFLYKAMPGKEVMLSLPIMRLGLTLNMKLWQKFELLTPKEKQQLQAYLVIIDKLIEGKTLRK